MTIEQLRNIAEARPFRPFTIHTADGRSLHVPHNDFLSHSPSGRTIIVYGENENFTVIDLLLVTQIEVKPNGAHKKKR